MTKRHYAHLLDSVVAAELQDKLPTFRTRSARKVAAGNGESDIQGARRRCNSDPSLTTIRPLAQRGDS